jgi:hypothetical protein
MLQHKFHAKMTVSDGIKFPSRKEAQYYAKLKILQNNGDIVFFLRQVPFDLPGNVHYRADFMIFWKDGTVTIVDVKGVKTKMYNTKKKQVEALYPIEILEV